jgi:hypothetical protein
VICRTTIEAVDSPTRRSHKTSRLQEPRSNLVNEVFIFSSSTESTMADPKASLNVDPAIFQFLQDKIDEEGKIRDVLNHHQSHLELQ